MIMLSYAGGCCCPTFSACRLRPSTPPSPGNPNLLLSRRNHSGDATRKNNLLLSSTAKSKPFNQILELFYRLSDDRDTVTWNTIISACLHHGHHRAALHLFLDMLLCCSHPPDRLTMRSVLIACIESNDFYLGLQMHSYIIKIQGLLLCSKDLTVVSTCLVNLYCHFGFVEDAHKVFDGIPDKDIIAFTSMLVGYDQDGQYTQALNMFVEMMEDNSITLNEYAFSCALHASTGITSLSAGRQIHAQVVKSSASSDAFVATSLVDIYAKCHEMDSAKSAFSEVFEPSVVAWNALLAGPLEGEEILNLFSQMRFSNAKPDNITFASVLRACRDLSICLAQQIHCLVVKTDEVDVDAFIGGAIFASYINQGLVCESQRIFHEITCKDIVAFNMAIQGCIENRYAPEAVKFLYEALETLKAANEETIVPLLIGIEGLGQLKQLHALSIKLGFDTDRGDSSISSSLVRVYSDYHCLDDALQLFECLHSPDLVTWTSIITGFSRAGESQGALNLYARMVSEGSTEPPNHYTFPSVITSCANLATIKEGKQVHAQIVKSKPSIASDPFVVSGLLHMYAKCGYIDEARRIFSGTKDRDLASWNAMITSLALHGFAQEAIETFTDLLKQNDLEPDHISFLGVLSACSHEGMVEKGFRYFKSIKEPTIDHYACLVNLLGRAGHLEEARHLAEEMPFEPNDHIWSSLLAASSAYGNIELGEYSAKHLMELNPTDPGAYVALSNMYAAAGRWNDVKHIRKLMKDRSLRKNPGLSWLSTDQETHVFFANDLYCNMDLNKKKK